MAPGSKLKLKVNREGKIIDINVTVASVPEEKASPQSTIQKLGINVQNLTSELAHQLGYIEEKGVVISRRGNQTPPLTKQDFVRAV